MAGERKPITIHYRKFVRPESAGATSSLEDLIRAAMSQPTRATHSLKDRYTERLWEQTGHSYFINTFEDVRAQLPLVFGDILHFTKGHLQALCETADQNANSVPVRQLKAPEQNEYVHSQMFWMVKGDHVFIVQSMSLKTEDLENYLSWLLHTKAAVLSPVIPIALTTKFDIEELGGDLDDIQEIIVGGVAAAPPTANRQTDSEAAPQKALVVSEETQRGEVGTGRRTGWATARKILAELLGGDANVDSVLNSVPPDAELNVQVHIGFQTKRRKIDRVALSQLETGLRNLPDSQLQVRAKGANIGVDGTLRLHHKASIRLIKAVDGENEIIGTLLDPQDVLRASIEAYSYLVNNGKITE